METDKQKYGLIGRHLSHSFSKPIHEALADYTYELLELEPEELERFFMNREFKAVNATIPYKQEAMKYLDEIDPRALEIGCTNCIVNNDGYLCGWNTDYDGIDFTFKQKGIDPKGKKVLILGKGGASKAFETWLKNNGAREILKVYWKEDPDCISYEEAKTEHQDAQIIINATPAGMYPNIDQLALDLEPFENLEFVYDAVYNPLKPRILIEADQRQIPNANGLYMLVEQARSACEHFTDQEIPKEKTLELWDQIMKEKMNIALVGMPGCGKSTLAGMLAEKAGKTLVDIDSLIEEKIQMPIARYFELYGEEAFRKLEAKITKEIAAGQNQIISTGGGVVLNPENVISLQQNSIVFYIDRPVELLVSEDETRPTLKQGLENLYAKRRPLYLHAADEVIENSGSLEDLLDKSLAILAKPDVLSRFA